MESLREHIGVVVAFCGVLWTITMFLTIALVRVKFGQIDDLLDLKRRQLQEHEERISKLEGKHGESGRDIEHLGDLLERLVKELKEAIADERENRKDFERANKADHDQIIGLIRQQHAEATP